MVLHPWVDLVVLGDQGANKQFMLLRIRLSENEPEEACDEKTLQAWVRAGKIQAHHLIWSQEKQNWIQAKKWPSLQGLFSSSLWDAWDSNDDWELDPDIETGIRERAKLPKSEVVKKEVVATKTNVKKPPKLPLSAIESLDDLSQVKKNTSPRKSLETVSSIERSQMKLGVPKSTPSKDNHPKTLAETWNPEANLRDQPQFWMEEEKKKKGVSILRVGLIVILGLVPLVGYREWFISEATSKFPLEEEIEAAQKGQPSEAKWIDVRRQESLIALEKELKDALRTDIQVVNQKHSFSDALLIEMTYVDLNIQNIVADVLSWKGRRLDVPKSSRVEVKLNSSGEVDRELALVSMVIAKYTEHYTLEMENFTVILHLDGTKISREIPVSEARNLLLRPGALPQFLETIVD